MECGLLAPLQPESQRQNSAGTSLDADEGQRHHHEQVAVSHSQRLLNIQVADHPALCAEEVPYSHVGKTTRQRLQNALL